MLITFDKTISITTPQDISKILQAWLKTLDKVESEKEHFFRHFPQCPKQDQEYRYGLNWNG